jgi:hypothetical protein
MFSFTPLLSLVGKLVILAVNALIAAFAVVLGALFSILPDMPALPSLPDAMVTAESWVAWFFPVGTLFDILAFVLSMWLLWQAVALALRWAKALQD